MSIRTTLAGPAPPIGDTAVAIRRVLAGLVRSPLSLQSICSQVAPSNGDDLNPAILQLLPAQSRHATVTVRVGADSGTSHGLIGRDPQVDAGQPRHEA